MTQTPPVLAPLHLLQFVFLIRFIFHNNVEWIKKFIISDRFQCFNAVAHFLIDGDSMAKKPREQTAHSALSRYRYLQYLPMSEKGISSKGLFVDEEKNEKCRAEEVPATFVLYLEAFFSKTKS